MSGSVSEQPLSTLPVVSVTTGLLILATDASGAPKAVEPAAFAAAPTQGPSLSDSPALALGATALAGVATVSSRADHRHPYPTAVQVGAADAVHTHSIADITALQAALDGKAALSHTHAISAVTGLQAALDSKASIAHTHPISDINALQVTLDGKQNLSARGVANGYAPLDANSKVPSANLPDIIAPVSNVANGTLDGQVATWSVQAARYQGISPTPYTSQRTRTVERNTPFIISFTEYNRSVIVATGNAPATLAASEVGVIPNAGLEFIYSNRHTAVNTITFGAGIEVDAYPVGTGTAGAVKVGSKGLVAVSIYPVGSGLVASVRGQIV